jgi:hypothetical protein
MSALDVPTEFLWIVSAGDGDAALGVSEVSHVERRTSARAASRDDQVRHRLANEHATVALEIRERFDYATLPFSEGSFHRGRLPQDETTPRHQRTGCQPTEPILTGRYGRVSQLGSTLRRSA